MGAGLQVLNGLAVNPSSTITPLTPLAGDSYTVRSTNMGADIELVQAWAFTTTNLLFRVRSPRMHDQAQNMRYLPTASKAWPLMPWGATQKLYSQDNMTVEITGGTSETDVGSLLLYYNDLPGVNARLFMWAQLQPLIVNLTTIQVTLTSSATAGNYSPTVPLNGTFDTLIRNVNYAILGWECPVAGVSFGITGVDTGNLRVGGPLAIESWLTRTWFKELSAETGKPMIPVFNAANVAGTMADVVAVATSTSYPVAIHLAELASSPG